MTGKCSVYKAQVEITPNCLTLDIAQRAAEGIGAVRRGGVGRRRSPPAAPWHAGVRRHENPTRPITSAGLYGTFDEC